MMIMMMMIIQITIGAAFSGDKPSYLQGVSTQLFHSQPRRHKRNRLLYAARQVESEIEQLGYRRRTCQPSTTKEANKFNPFSGCRCLLTYSIGVVRLRDPLFFII